MSGWASVGQGLGALFGGGADREQAVYQDQLLKNATTADKMAIARANQLKAIGREGTYNDQTLSELERNLIVGELGGQFANVQRGNLRAQELGYRDEAFIRADAAGYGVNAPLFALENGVVEVNKSLANGQMQGDVFLPGAEHQVTRLGLGELFKDETAGNANNALANQRNQSAALYQDKRENSEKYMRPTAPRAGGSADPGVWSVKEVNEIIEFNRAASRPGSGRTPIEPVPTPFTPKNPAPVEPVASPPTVGEVLDGYRFKGGAPGDPANWEKV